MKRFIQTPTMLAIRNQDLPCRVIFMDGRAPEADPNPSWMGYSVGRWDGDTLVVESLSGETLFASAGGGEKRPLIPQSETTFTGTGLTYRFIRHDHGVATNVIEGHVSGDYKYASQK